MGGRACSSYKCQITDYDALNANEIEPNLESKLME